MTPLTRVPQRFLSHLLNEPQGFEGFGRRPSVPTESLITYAWGASSNNLKGYKTNYQSKKAENTVIIRGYIYSQLMPMTQAETTSGQGQSNGLILKRFACVEQWLGEWILLSRRQLPSGVPARNICPLGATWGDTTITVCGEDPLYFEHNPMPSKVKKMYECHRHGGFSPKKTVVELEKSTRMTEAWRPI